MKSVYVRYLKLDYFTYRQSIRLKRKHMWNIPQDINVWYLLDKTRVVFDESLAMNFDILIYLFS